METVYIMYYFILTFLIGFLFCIFIKNKKILIMVFIFFSALWIGMSFYKHYDLLDVALLIIEYKFLTICFFHEKRQTLLDKIKSEIRKDR